MTTITAKRMLIMTVIQDDNGNFGTVIDKMKSGFVVFWSETRRTEYVQYAAAKDLRVY